MREEVLPRNQLANRPVRAVFAFFVICALVRKWLKTYWLMPG
ncbi:MAG TPA: hypothetical protein PK513_08345 [Alphaproteobacteria bacterium]|nr:hypothetical protein [Alphaproteobacteria bacterium]